MKTEIKHIRERERIRRQQGKKSPKKQPDDNHIFVPQIPKEPPIKKGKKRTPPDIENSILWRLDDTRPAGPYISALDDFGLRLICLAIIRQAVMDVHASKNPDVIARARQFLAGQARDWLRAMMVFRRGGLEKVYDLIYRQNCEQLLLLIEDEQIFA